MILAGIDAGSRAIKAVLFDAGKNRILASSLLDQGVDQRKRAQQCLDQLLEENALSTSDVHRCIATGYGRHLLDFCDTTITEISCHAAGVTYYHTNAKTIIDIGGQDSKLIRMNRDGRVRDFVMNDRCAAGTGRFIEIVAGRLEVPLEKLGEYGQKSETPANISSMCVVFAETEIIGLLARGESQSNIIAGVQHSLARRIVAMSGADPETPVVFTGGVALISGIKETFEKLLDHPITICENPRYTGALGAAILGAGTMAQ